MKFIQLRSLFLIFTLSIALTESAISSPPPPIETVLYNFSGGSDGESLQYGGLTAGPDGVLYGLTYGGGLPDNYGTVFQLTTQLYE